MLASGSFGAVHALVRTGRQIVDFLRIVLRDQRDDVADRQDARDCVTVPDGHVAHPFFVHLVDGVGHAVVRSDAGGVGVDEVLDLGFQIGLLGEHAAHHRPFGEGAQDGGALRGAVNDHRAAASFRLHASYDVAHRVIRRDHECGGEIDIGHGLAVKIGIRFSGHFALKIALSRSVAAVFSGGPKNTGDPSRSVGVCLLQMRAGSTKNPCLEWPFVRTACAGHAYKPGTVSTFVESGSVHGVFRWVNANIWPVINGFWENVMTEPEGLLSAMRSTIRSTDAEPKESLLLENMIETVLGALEGDYKREQAVQAVDQERKRMQLVLSSHEGQFNLVRADEEVTAALEKVRAEHQRYDAELVRLEAATNAGEADDAVASLRDLANVMRESAIVLQDGLRRLQPKAARPTANASPSATAAPAVNETETVPVPAVYAELLDVSKELSVGKATRAKWTKVLSTARQDMVQMRDVVNREMGAAQRDPEATARLNGALKAVGDALTAMDTMERYPTSGDVNDLKSGWNTLLDAIVAITRALKLKPNVAKSSRNADVRDQVVIDDDE